MTEMKFFVYGSLCEGLVHFNKIKEFVLESAPASLRAQAYRLNVGYPVVLEAGEQKIDGQFLRLKGSEILLALLDSFHGELSKMGKVGLHYRAEKTILLQDGQEESAWVYFLNPQQLPPSALCLEDGDWRKSLSEKPPMTQFLSEKQRNYILRLGASSGREIVPIDLGLYRELMNLELIVDKGRRLALSKLGNEVYRFLT